MRISIRLCAVLILIAGLAVSAAAQQTGTVTGTLTNSLSGDPVPNALVSIEAPAFTRSGRSGSDGKFSLADIPAGSYHLTVRADGYLPSRTEVTVAAGSQTSDIRINPELHFSEVTSVSPDSKSQFETFQATNVLGGQELAKDI